MTSQFRYDLHSLRIFIVVAELGSLTKAAEQTNMTLSAVSKRIADLEHSTDCTLLQRLPRGIELTPLEKACFLMPGRSWIASTAWPTR